MKDYYSILHVLPSAEIDVIRAAYKALARKYHPDTFDGDKAYASKRMQEINDAFGVIGDPDKRKKYDAEREKENQEADFSSNDNDVDARLEEDWVVACKYCPEAKESFSHLSKLSRSLAFAFKSYLLDSKQFSECKTIRDKFRAEFLKNYFGSNPEIQSIGEKLVLAGELKAAKSINRAVKVMGHSLIVSTLVEKLNADFSHLKVYYGNKHEQEPSKARQLLSELKGNPYNWDLQKELLQTLNIPYELSIWGNYKITYQGKLIRLDTYEFNRWILDLFANDPSFRNK